MAKTKYRNRKTMRIIDGKPVTFDSEKEAQRYAELRLLERAGRIRGLDRQVRFEVLPQQKDADGTILERSVVYKADFTYHEPDDSGSSPNGWRYVVEDVKGVRTKEYIIKRKLMLHRLGIRIREV